MSIRKTLLSLLLMVQHAYRLMDIIRTNQDNDAQALCACIAEAVLDFLAPSLPEDDITLVVIKTH